MLMLNGIGKSIEILLCYSSVKMDFDMDYLEIVHTYVYTHMFQIIFFF
jgi:hypothetical protein